ncbi:MAG: hypothetical protein ACPGQF_11560, partial [Akkermansiaceae bacterium]
MKRKRDDDDDEAELRQPFKEDDVIDVQIVSADGGEEWMTVKRDDAIRNMDLNLRVWHQLMMDGQPLALNQSFEENGVNDGARLHLHEDRKEARDVIEELGRLNPVLDDDTLAAILGLKVRAPYDIVGNLELSEVITQLPPSFGHLDILGKLDLSSNPLEYLPEEFGSVATSIDLRWCENLELLPDRIIPDDSIHLEELMLSDCESLVSLPESIGRCKSLTSLDLTYCISLVSLPDTIGDLTSLTKLSLGSC